MKMATKRKRMEAAKAAFDEQIVKMKQDEEARGLWCECGHSTHDHNCGYTCQSVACRCLVFTPKVVELQPAITLSNFRVEYYAPKYDEGKVLYDGYCAILADNAEFDGATVRVFNVPDADESQRAVAQFACEAMNAHEQLVQTLRNVLADCETAQERRTTADLDFATCHAIEYAREALAEVERATTTSISK